MSDNQKVVMRFAPSPTGFMHIGNVRSALYAWLWTRKQGGTFILRIEDTDKEREVSGSTEHIQESLKWLGIEWDEGPGVGGPHAPYLQSERLEIYKAYAQKLIAKGFAYPDPYTTEEVDVFRKKAEEEKRAFLFRDHRPETFDVWDGTKPLRFKVPEIKSYSWNDIVFGDLAAGPEALDDFILIKADGYPTYNFAHIVDDIEMGITLVMRGQEYISSTPKFLSVYEALEITPPHYACLPHIMAPGGQKKLGKRDGAKDILQYREEGYLPEAMMNFLALIGWNPGTEQEVFTKEELIKAFTLDRVHKAGGGANEEKLDWLNREHIKKLDMAGFWNHAHLWLPTDKPWLKDDEPTREMLKKIEPLIRDRIDKFSDIKTLFEAGEFDYFFTEPTIDEKMIIWKNDTLENAKKHLAKVKEILETIPEEKWKQGDIKDAVMPYAEQEGRGNVLWPFRVCLSGKEKSPDPFELAAILGKEKVLGRLNEANS